MWDVMQARNDDDDGDDDDDDDEAEAGSAVQLCWFTIHCSLSVSYKMRICDVKIYFYNLWIFGILNCVFKFLKIWLYLCNITVNICLHVIFVVTVTIVISRFIDLL